MQCGDARSHSAAAGGAAAADGRLCDGRAEAGGCAGGDKSQAGSGPRAAVPFRCQHPLPAALAGLPVRSSNSRHAQPIIGALPLPIACLLEDKEPQASTITGPHFKAEPNLSPYTAPFIGPAACKGPPACSLLTGTDATASHVMAMCMGVQAADRGAVCPAPAAGRSGCVGGGHRWHVRSRPARHLRAGRTQLGRSGAACNLFF